MLQHKCLRRQASTTSTKAISSPTTKAQVCSLYLHLTLHEALSGT
jgi:hypothetical protein